MSGFEADLRALAPQVLGTLVRRHGQFDACEDAVQEALLAAVTQWPSGMPDDPRAWLLTVATRRLTDMWRSESARRRREEADALRTVPSEPSAVDDTLRLLFLCCHPDLSPSSQVALTLRAVGGLTTAQIARAFLVPEATMAQRISRAKARVRGGFTEHDGALPAVLQVLYLIFNEGYTAGAGADLLNTDLTAEAIRLTRLARAALPDEPEVTALLALMLLTDARRPARTAPDGGLVPLEEQDRTLWNRDQITEGVRLASSAMSTGGLGPYRLQAAIAAVHAEAPSAAETDWRQIAVLYRILSRIAPNPMVTLSHAVAVAMVEGPSAGLALLDTLDDDSRVAHHHRLAAVRAHLLEMTGDPTAARAAYLAAARATASAPEQRYLTTRADRLRADPPAPPQMTTSSE
ncbi:RNA polymerase sigma factor [Actinokineospora fastidiosa]|uniref:RNA polymerase sigma24 factor n=1 Tax=Actinokineospora fastidiosa TaxID=1816 RepID=A0A918GM30_9PSEU|nr:sigma-70 family RNA polymerase sigma factor [Actinokineospora fastidiosa]GGS42529.1 RNA polymerase sigma24 factor [Actinokineospora fastidiosa]